MSAEASSAVVQTRLVGEIFVITINNPPVNALSTEVRKGLFQAVQQAHARKEVRAILLVGAGKSFIAGADIREFGKPLHPPSLSEVFELIEMGEKLVVVAIQGYALGGGLEMALASHYRIALDDAKLGLPEINLGLMPGAGGTQRAPRLMGVEGAAELMLTGKHITAQDAFEAGLVDRVAQGTDPVHVGCEYIDELLTSGLPIRRTRDLPIPNINEASAKIDETEANIVKKSAFLFAPLKIVECLRNAVNLPMDVGLKEERKAFLECMASPQRMGLTHAFFAEREVIKVPGATANNSRPINNIAVIGGGTMGAGITVAALDAGLPVTMIERNAELLTRGRTRVEDVYRGLIRKGRLTPGRMDEIMSRYTGSNNYEDIKNADIVIEAVFEDLETKKAVFQELDGICKQGAVLATNTSFLNINEIAGCISRPEDVIGLHFFSPANIMKLLEVVVTDQVSPDVVSTVFRLAGMLKKIPVQSGVCEGFIGNRILSVYKRAAEYLMEDGASPYDIDAAVREFGYPMGPFQVVDLAGGDIGWATRKRKASTRSKEERYVEIADRICERGWFGQKTGRGYYLYPNGTRIGEPDPEVLEIVAGERARKGITPRAFTKEEIMRRYMAAMINEGANVLHDGIALRPLDIDITFLYGYGFPRFRGGPMKYADMVGLENILSDINDYSKEDPVFWKPSPLLVQLVKEGRTFDSLNKWS